MACNPLMCCSTGRAPMAQPPGKDTLAFAQRASRGPNASTEARMVLTSSYGACGLSGSLASKLMPPRSPCVCTNAPMFSSSLRMVATSRKRGTLRKCTGSVVSRAAHISGKAAFFAPEMAMAPCSGRPPRISSLSMSQTCRSCCWAHSAGVNVFIESACTSSVCSRSPTAA